MTSFSSQTWDSIPLEQSQRDRLQDPPATSESCILGYLRHVNPATSSFKLSEFLLLSKQPNNKKSLS